MSPALKPVAAIVASHTCTAASKSAMQEVRMFCGTVKFSMYK